MHSTVIPSKHGLLPAVLVATILFAGCNNDERFRPRSFAVIVGSVRDEQGVLLPGLLVSGTAFDGNVCAGYPTLGDTATTSTKVGAYSLSVGTDHGPLCVVVRVDASAGSQFLSFEKSDILVDARPAVAGIDTAVVDITLTRAGTLLRSER